ncbi:Niemann-Pick type C-2f [Cochliomyia hominivorax]
MKGVTNLKILLLSWYLLLASSSVQGISLGKYASDIAKKILMTKSLPFEDCGSKYLIFYLNISGCSSIPCVMHRGDTVQVNVLFDDDSNETSYLKHRVRWIFNAIKTQAHITPDPCDGHQKCLSNDNKGKFYWATVLVNNTLPTISGTMLWEAVNENNQDVICFKVPVVVTN